MRRLLVCLEEHLASPLISPMRAQNDEDLERTFHQLQVITKAETARAEKAAADLRRERALASAALLRESDAELERRMSSTSPPESAQHSPRQAAPAPAFGFDSSPFGDDKSTAAAVSETESNGGAEAAVQALASKLLEQRRARARASAERFAQQAHHKTECVPAALHRCIAASDASFVSVHQRVRRVRICSRSSSSRHDAVAERSASGGRDNAATGRAGGAAAALDGPAPQLQRRAAVLQRRLAGSACASAAVRLAGLCQHPSRTHAARIALPRLGAVLKTHYERAVCVMTLKSVTPGAAHAPRASAAAP